MAPRAAATRRKNHPKPAAEAAVHQPNSWREEASPDNSSTTTVAAISSDENRVKNSGEEEEADDNSCNNCSTPKGKRYRIPEVGTCPPAPKKRRMASKFGLKGSPPPVAFFASPDVELFFFFALRGISVSN